MILIFAAVTGFLVALLIHSLTWTLRLKYPTLTVIGGVLSGAGLTGFCLLFLNSDIANMMLIVLVIFWAVALLLGGLQSFALKVPWWRSTLAVFFEMGLAFLSGAAVNLTLQRYIPWFEEQFPGTDVYAVINSFLWALIITLLILAVVRPLIQRDRTRAGQSI